MKNLIVMALTMGIGCSAYAASSSSNRGVITVAQVAIVNYGLFRVQGLGGAFGKELGQNQICGLAGQAFTGFQVLEAAGVSEIELADLFKGLEKSGLTVEHFRAQVNLDIEDCLRN
jgi:hypothetical protein